MDFSQKFQMQRYSMCLPFDFLLSCGYWDAFTDFLARSVHELWLIKDVPASAVAGTGRKGDVTGRNGLSAINILLLWLKFVTSRFNHGDLQVDIFSLYNYSVYRNRAGETKLK